MALFINPYTFVPHVSAPQRGEPAGHAEVGPGRLSGVLKVRLTARTPLVIGGFKAEGSDVQVVPRRRAPEGVAMVPGSGLLGAVRSVHEALAGGCLRVLNPDWVPVHRHPANTQETQDLSLAVVTDVDGKGRALRISLCEERMRVPVEALRREQGHLPRTGDQLRHLADGGREVPLPQGGVIGPAARRTLLVRSDEHPQGVRPGSMARIAGMGPVTGNCWVLLITDTRARQGDRPLHFVAGRIGSDSRSYVVPSGTWEGYEKTVAGADDLRPALLRSPGNPEGEEPLYDPGDPAYVPVEPPGGGEPVAERLRARTYLHVGQPVWVRVREADREVTEIRLSVLWRYQGEGTVGERAGAAMPCAEPSALCWSCRVFGSADTGGRRETDPAVQKGYRGHVRFDDLLADDDFTPVMWHLAPLSSPRPGSGQFYLDNRRPGTKRLSDKDTRPAATWGSEADKRQPRPIRGRKFYWRTDGDPTGGAHPRGRFREHQAEQLGKYVELIPAGTVFSGRVRFDNLSAAEYGSLLVALDPRLLARADDVGWQDTVTSVGGGKPFGFGAVIIDVEPEIVQTARLRYLGEPEPESVPVPDRETAVRVFREAVPSAARAQWGRLRHALTWGYVDDDLVWYPPGAGEKGSEGFDESFEFFALTNGVRMTTGEHMLLDLPDSAGDPQAQVLDSPAGQVRQADGSQGSRDQRPQRRGGHGRRG
jgi:hypothetical protein